MPNKTQSFNVPVPELESAMDLSEHDFEAKYGFEKPSTSTSIVTHCMKGGRARRAGDLFKSKGYQARWVGFQSVEKDVWVSVRR